MKKYVQAVLITACVFSINLQAFDLDGFVGYETRPKAAETGRQFISLALSGDIEKACDLFWAEKVHSRQRFSEAFRSNLKPMLPQLGKRKGEHFVGALTVGDFWFELAYIEVFENSVMFVTLNFARPDSDKWYIKDAQYTVKTDFSKLVEEIPAAYKKLVTTEREL